MRTYNNGNPGRLSARWFLILTVALFMGMYACSGSRETANSYQAPATEPQPLNNVDAPTPDPRVGLEPGLFDAGEAIWNLNMISQTPPPEDFVGVTNSDLAFKDHYAFQGNYNGVIVWDISNPAEPSLVVDYLCPASQSDVSVYGNLLFVSGEGLSGRLDCGTEGVEERVSEDRLRGIRIFDISNVEEPEYISNVQTCRGSHTHSVLKDPKDDENVYVYVSGSASVRPEEELPGCSSAIPEEDPESALFRIEIIKVPLDNPQEASIVSSPRIFENLEPAPSHGMAPADKAALEQAREEGKFIAHFLGRDRIVPDNFVQGLLKSTMKERGRSGEPTAADSAYLRENLQSILEARFGGGDESRVQRGPDQCHDITLYPEIGLAGGACEGYGLLLDITDPANPVRLDAVADSNFSYWHSATFNNEGSKVLFTDEWGGGGQPKCRESDPMEWGANAIFTIDGKEMNFQSYYKMPAPQTSFENCVAHNGSLIPVPDRDIMVQSWYQGGISIFDWTDAKNPVEIAFHDRGPADTTGTGIAGSWSVYWYNGVIVNSEIGRGLDIFELKPNPYMTRNEIEAAKTVQLDYLNAQGQPKFKWPTTFALAGAYIDQLDRDIQIREEPMEELRTMLRDASRSSGSKRARLLNDLADKVEGMDQFKGYEEKVDKLSSTLRDLATM